MKDRIRQIMEAQHMTQQVFANAIGTTPATLSGIYNDRTRPTINIIESIKKRFPNVSLEWLMFGQGDMYQQPTTPAEGSEAELQTAQSGLFGQEKMLDFSQSAAPTPSAVHPVAPSYNGVRNTHAAPVNFEVKNIDKPTRHVTEIRVYYDDQTWESFVPAKK